MSCKQSVEWDDRFGPRRVRDQVGPDPCQCEPSHDAVERVHRDCLFLGKPVRFGLTCTNRLEVPQGGNVALARHDSSMPGLRFDGHRGRVHHDPSVSRATARNNACNADTSASSSATSGTGICDIVIRMSGNAFCSCSLDVFREIPVRETVRESSEPGELPAVRFPPPPLHKRSDCGGSSL